MGRDTGYCRAPGGPMHIAALDLILRVPANIFIERAEH